MSASLNATIAGVIASTDYTTVGAFDNTSADTLWLMVCAFLVFFMQCGFALLEAGTVRAKNTKNILLKNLLDACVGAMIWYSFGHAIAYEAGARLLHAVRLRNAGGRRRRVSIDAGYHAQEPI